MLSAIRAFAKSWFAWVIFAALVVSFALFSNVGDVLRPTVGDWVVLAGKHKVTSPEFKREFENLKQEQEQQAQQQLPLEQVVELGFDKAVLERVAGQVSAAELLRKLGMRVSNAQLTGELRKFTAFFNPISGAFDKDTYARLVGQNGMTPVAFEAKLRDEIAAQQFNVGMNAGLRAPRAYSALVAAYVLESRDVSYFTVDARSVGPVPAPTDAEMQKFLTENAAQLMRPEFRVLSVVRFSARAALPTVTVDPAALQKTFDFRKDSLSTPETRSLVQIPVKDQATAAAVAARLQKGEDPTVVAASLKIEPVTLSDKPKSAITDRRVADAAFKLAAGQVSGPIQGDLSWAVVKVFNVKPGVTATLDAVRPQLEAELREKAAQAKIFDQSQRFTDAQEAGSNLMEAAQKSGATVVTLAPVSDKGGDPDGRPVEGVDPKMLKSAFALSAGGETQVEEAGPGEYYAVRVEKIIPPAPPSLDKVRPDLSRYLMQREVAKRLRARADAFAARVRKGESLEQVAASAGGQVVHVVGIDRASARGRVQELGQQFLVSLIEAKKGDVFLAPLAPPAPVVAVARIDAVRAGDTPDLAQFTERQRAGLSQQMLADLAKQQQEEARRIVKTRTNLRQARVAVGLDKDMIAKLEAKEKPAEAAKPEKKK